MADSALPQELFNKLLLQQNIQNSDDDNVKILKPTAGFCIKTKDADENKVFINLCHSEALPAPDDISEEQLQHILEAEENEIVNYRVPLSLGEAKIETDKSGNLCTAYDVAINSKFYKKVSSNVLFKNFVIQVAFEGLEDKHRIALKKQDWTILKNRKCLGDISEARVKTRKEPLIKEVAGDQGGIADTKSKMLIEEIDSENVQPTAPAAPQPEYKIVREPVEGYPKQLVAQFQLPGVMAMKNIQLDLGEDRIVLQVQPNKFYLDVFLPYMLVVEETTAQFDHDQQVLRVTLAVVPQN